MPSVRLEPQTRGAWWKSYWQALNRLQKVGVVLLCRGLVPIMTAVYVRGEAQVVLGSYVGGPIVIIGGVVATVGLLRRDHWSSF